MKPRTSKAQMEFDRRKRETDQKIQKIQERFQNAYDHTPKTNIEYYKKNVKDLYKDIKD